MVSSLNAAPVLNMGITLLDSANVALPKVGSVYTLAAGQSFRVLVTATLAAPNQSDAGHSDDNTGDPLPALTLGLQNLAFDILSSGQNSGNGLTPFATTTGTPGKWGLGSTTALLANKLAQPATVNFDFVNLSDDGTDGDLDPLGAGFNNTKIAYNASTDAQGLQNGIGTQINIIRGGYTVGATGGILTTRVTSANAYSDPAAASNALQADSILGTAVNASVVIAVGAIPEPASVGLAGLGLLGLLGARRRQA